MNRTPLRRSATRRPLQALLLSASALAVAAPATAADVVFSTDRGFAPELDRRTSQADGLTQIRLDSGAIASFVDAADYRLNADGSIDLYGGSVTIAGAEGAVTVVRMPEGVEGRVGAGSAGSFSVAEDGTARGHALTGQVTVVGAGNTRVFDAGEMWAANDARLRLVVSNGAQQAPDASTAEAPVLEMAEGGAAAPAANGIPVSLPDALAYAGASSDIVLAARKVHAAVANPTLEAFPTGDLALLVSYAAQLEAPYGGQAFPAARADIIRAYLGYLSAGGAGQNFLTAYASFLTQYLDLIRAGALPSSFDGAGQADIHAFIAYTGRTSGFGALSAQNRALVEAYVQFLASGGNPDLFARSYTDLVGAYFAFLRGGGDPLAFQGASEQTLAAYIGFLSRSGLAARLSSADRALLDAYLANGGLAFTSQYRTALDAYFTYLQAGKRPSAYVGLDAATLRIYLEALQRTGLFEQVLGAQAQFYSAFLAHLQSGGAADAFAGLNANIFTGYASQLAAYYEFLLQGGQPSAYTALTQQQIAAYLAALEAAGAGGAYLDGLAEFYSGYLAHLSNGGNPDLYTGLPSLNLPGFADALNAYAAFLAAGGLPSGYGAVDLTTLSQYLDALSRSGQLATLLGANADLIQAYFAHFASGGAADRYAGLPIYATYVDALRGYYAFLDAGGLPAAYTALTQAQVQEYLAALAAAGGISAQLGELANFYTGYYAFIAGGGDPANFVGLPVYADYAAALRAYYAFLAAGGLPADYTALTQAQIQNYLAALSAAGGLSVQLGELASFYSDYYAFVAGGGNPAHFGALPVYADYTAALQAYYAFLAGGGLPTEYTALTQGQIQSYLAALAAAGGLSARLGDLAGFYGDYYAFVAAGGNPAQFAGLPVYDTWLAALEAYYAYLGSGGLPSAYTALTQDQIRAYIEALNGAGVLQAELTAEARDFILAYLAFVQTGANPDTFGQLPANNQGPTLLAGANVWIFSAEGGRVGTAPTADVTTEGQIRSVSYATTPNNAVTFDYTAAGNTLKEHGRAGDAVAWTRYDRGTAGGVSNQNVHLLLGTPAVNLPASGTADYKLIGGTAPTNAMAPAGEIGAFSGDLAVAFGTTPRVGLNFEVHVGTRGWRAQTPGGAAGAASGGLPVGGDMRFQTLDLARSGIAGNACAGYCNVQVFGGLFGEGAGNAGFEYHIDDQSSGGRSYVNGTAVFGTSGAELALIGTMPVIQQPDPDPVAPTYNSVPAPISLAYSGGFNPATASVNFYTTLTISGGTKVPGSETGMTTTAFALDPSGGLTSYTRTGNVTRTNGSTTIADVSGNANVIIGRWTDGVNTGGNTFTLSENQGFHYMLARPVPGGFALPTQGVVHYDLLAATRPTLIDGSAPPGGFTADLALVLGPAPKVAFEAEITMPALAGQANQVFRYATPGGTADPNQSDVGLTALAGGNVQFRVSGVNGTSCQTTECWFDAKGVFAGSLEQIGLSYAAYNDLGNSKAIIGAAMFGNGTHTGAGPVIDPDTGNLVNAFVLTDHLLADSGRNETMDLSGNLGSVGYQTNADGEIIAMKQDFGLRLGDNIGTARNADTGRTDSGAVRWTRWTEGTLDHVRSGPQAPIQFSANQGYHVLVGTPATNVPTSGRVNYQLVGGTKPTSVGGVGAPGQLTSGSAAIQFGATPKLGIELAFTQNGASYAMRTAGGLTNLAASEISLAADTTFRAIGTYGQGVQLDGAACATCRPIWEGFLAGPKGGELALSYTMQSQSGDRIIGAAGFLAQASSPAPTNPYANAPDAWSRFDSANAPQAGLSIEPLPVTASEANAILGGAISFAGQ